MDDLRNYRDALIAWDRRVPYTWDGLKLAVLLDIRDHLRSISTLLHCERFLAVPAHLAAIHRNTERVKKRTARKAKKASSKRGAP